METGNIESEIRGHQLHLVSQNAAVGLVATAAASLVLVAASGESPNILFWWLWWLGLMGISIIRFGMAGRYLREEAEHTADLQRWYSRYVALIAALSFMWAAGIAGYSWHAPETARLLAALVAAAMAAGSISTLAPLITLYRIYASPMSSPWRSSHSLPPSGHSICCSA